MYAFIFIAPSSIGECVMRQYAEYVATPGIEVIPDECLAEYKQVALVQFTSIMASLKLVCSGLDVSMELVDSATVVLAKDDQVNSLYVYNGKYEISRSFQWKNYDI